MKFIYTSFACFSYTDSEDCYVDSLKNLSCSYFPKKYLDIPLPYCVKGYFPLTYDVLPWWRVFHNQYIYIVVRSPHVSSIVNVHVISRLLLVHAVALYMSCYS